MNILVVDDETTAAKSLERSLKRILGENTLITAAKSGTEALEAMKECVYDVLFLDVEMPGVNGLDVAKKVKAEYPHTNVIIVTAYPQYSLKAWELYISGYLLKPAGTKRIEKALENLRKQPRAATGERLTVQCFGNFDVFWRGKRILFGRSAAKEMFAYLVTRRGMGATAGEICAVIWQDSVQADKQKGYIRIYYAEIKKTLAQIGMEDILVHTRNDYAINPARLDCDYYRYLDGDPEAEKLYHGEFMSRYEWAWEEMQHR